jgi:hypothetical protein
LRFFCAIEDDDPEGFTCREDASFDLISFFWGPFLPLFFTGFKSTAAGVSSSAAGVVPSSEFFTTSCFECWRKDNLSPFFPSETIQTFV